MEMLGLLGRKEKSEIGLPDEIIYEILVSLPMDQLLNCRAVCKSWNSLIKSPAFILSHLKRTLLIKSNISQKNDEKDDLLLLHAKRKKEDPCGGEFFMLDCDDTNDEYTKRRVIPISNIKAVSSIYGGREINLEDCDAIGTCNGLICLVLVETQVQIPVIWNPCVRKVLVLPSPSLLPYVCARYVVYKLGYDSHNNDFKLLQIVQPGDFPKDDQAVHRFQVFSLLKGSWKHLDAPVGFKPYAYDVKAVEICGALHWVCSERLYEMNESTVIVTFNLSTELFGQMKIPEALKKRSPKNCHKLKYRESFALLTRRSRTSDLWVMNEYGVAESWTKVLTIRMAEGLGRLPIYFRKNDRILLGTLWRGVESFDRKRKHVKVMVNDRQLITFMDPFLESLVLLDRSDAFSY